eukprot:Skav230150  [mRNA]  locus=scaffold1301:305701:316176:- [translate_table: standard]
MHTFDRYATNHRILIQPVSSSAHCDNGDVVRPEVKSCRNMEQLAPLGVYFVAQRILPEALAGVVPETVLRLLPVILAGLTFFVMHKITAAQTEAATAALVGQEAPDFQVEDDSGSQSLKDFLKKNKKPTVIDFYQNFCPACGPAAKQIEELAGNEKYKDKVTFMLVNLKSLEDSKKYAKERELKGNAWHGTGQPHPDYGLKYIPHKVLIDSDGKIVKNFKVNLPADLDTLLEESKKAS